MGTKWMTALSACAVMAGAAVSAETVGHAALRGSQESGAAAGWTANGATACKKYLTLAFLAPLLPQPNGNGEARQDGKGCVFGAESKDGSVSILIELRDHVSTADWDGTNKKYHPNAVAVTGVGDRAIRSADAYSLYAYKTDGRTCAVVMMPLGNMPTLTGDALAKKMGTICNQLFALP